MVQNGNHALDVIADDRRPIAVTHRDTADESRHQRELAPQHVVHHAHLATVKWSPPVSVRLALAISLNALAGRTIQECAH